MGQQQLDEICYIRKVDWDSLPVEAKNNRLASYKFILIKETGSLLEMLWDWGRL